MARASSTASARCARRTAASGCRSAGRAGAADRGRPRRRAQPRLHLPEGHLAEDAARGPRAAEDPDAEGRRRLRADLLGRGVRRDRAADAGPCGDATARTPSVPTSATRPRTRPRASPPRCLKKVLGSKNMFSAGSVDQFPQYLSSLLMFGDHTLLPVADIDRTDHLLVIGANPAVSNGSLSTMPDARGRLKAVRARGGRVVVLDPRRTETARLASEHVSIRPGGDPYLLLAMLNVIFEEGLDQRPPWADGLDEVRRLAAQHPPELGGERQRDRRRDDHPAGPRVRRSRLRGGLRPPGRVPLRHRQRDALADQRAQHRHRQPRPARRRHVHLAARGPRPTAADPLGTLVVRRLPQPGCRPAVPRRGAVAGSPGRRDHPAG